MSKYTTEVRYICESAAGFQESPGYNSVNEIINLAVPRIFDFDFPIFDESYRCVLCSKILKHYYTREIAFETVGLWKLMLETRMSEIMPYYNRLYKVLTDEFNPLNETDTTRTHTLNRVEVGNDVNKQEATSQTKQMGESQTTDTSSLKQNNKGSNSFSDTPQGSLTYVEQGKYLTTATITTDTSSNEGKNVTDNNTVSQGSSTTEVTTDFNKSFNSTDEFIEKLTGRNTNAGSLLESYKTELFNIDMRVISDLADLFFNLY